MRKITVDFSLQTYPLFAGYVGEHNATELTAIKPDDLDGVTYSLAFMTNGEVIHSEFFGADEEIKVTLWQQLTQDNTLYVQLEAYDENGDYLGKSGMVKLILSNSAHGIDMVADADNPDVYSEIAQNSAFREMLEDNADTLDRLTTSKGGRLLFNGEEIGGGNGVSEELENTINENTLARHTHTNKSVLDDFGVDYINYRPTFRSDKDGKKNIIAFQEDVASRVAEHRAEVLELISAIPKFSIAVVDDLPEENISSTTVYLVRSVDGSDDDWYREYIYVDGEWELLGIQSNLVIEDIYPDEPPLAGGGSGSGAVSPTIAIEAIEGGHRVTITDADGTESFDILNGYTPVKGVDYFTEADKTEIANAVRDALETAEGGLY